MSASSSRRCCGIGSTRRLVFYVAVAVMVWYAIFIVVSPLATWSSSSLVPTSNRVHQQSWSSSDVSPRSSSSPSPSSSSSSPSSPSLSLAARTAVATLSPRDRATYTRHALTLHTHTRVYLPPSTALLKHPEPGREWTIMHDGLVRHPFITLVPTIADADFVLATACAKWRPRLPANFTAAQHARLLLVDWSDKSTRHAAWHGAAESLVYFKRSWVTRRAGVYVDTPAHAPHMAPFSYCVMPSMLFPDDADDMRDDDDELYADSDAEVVAVSSVKSNEQQTPEEEAEDEDDSVASSSRAVPLSTTALAASRLYTRLSASRDRRDVEAAAFMRDGNITSWLSSSSAAATDALEPLLDIGCFLRADKGGGRSWALAQARAYAATHAADSSVHVGPVSQASRESFDDTYRQALHRSRIVLTHNPSRWEGDSRTWEALAAGALVFVDRMRTPVGVTHAAHSLVHRRHVVFYDHSRPHQLQRLLRHYLTHPHDARRIARAGRAHALRFHATVNRADYFITRGYRELRRRRRAREGSDSVDGDSVDDNDDENSL